MPSFQCISVPLFHSSSRETEVVRLATLTKTEASSTRGPITTIEVYLSIPIVKVIFPIVFSIECRGRALSIRGGGVNGAGMGGGKKARCDCLPRDGAYLTRWTRVSRDRAGHGATAALFHCPIQSFILPPLRECSIPRDNDLRDRGNARFRRAFRRSPITYGTSPANSLGATSPGV